jgi:hypothetical protein
VASNGDGTSYSPDQTLTTTSNPLAPRPLACLNSATPLVDLIVPNGILLQHHGSPTVTATVRNRNPCLLTGSGELTLLPRQRRPRTARAHHFSSAPVAANSITTRANSQASLYLILQRAVIHRLKHHRHGLPVQIALHLFDPNGTSATIKGTYLLKRAARP